MASGTRLEIDEICEVASIITEAAHKDARVIFSTVRDMDKKGELCVTVIATGI
ncbi:hypothetical protein LJC46_05900 [Desulfovibrio sp. OttesenSCG-928-G15]|nr:hypothetical protein [Desulfovibrio sp. OttesenSCG-928-G15]